MKRHFCPQQGSNFLLHFLQMKRVGPISGVLPLEGREIKYGRATTGKIHSDRFSAVL